jgi:FAD/FMN-containing dehydrogenase
VFGVPSVQAAVDLLGLAYERAGSQVTSFELMTRMNVELAVRFIDGTRDPLDAPHPYYVLMELSSQAESGLRDVVEAIFEAGVERGLVNDGAIAESLDQAKAMWRIREDAGEVQKREGASIKHDVSVPVAAIPAFIAEASAAAVAIVPGARPMPFGHVGDGNIHYNVTQPPGMDKAAFMAREDDVQRAVFGVVAKYGGSISAEHGIGIAKRDWLPRVKDEVALQVMRSLKQTLDPNGILNPGKVL